mgnify:CR=1 FL=1
MLLKIKKYRMTEINRKQHWENVYTTKNDGEVSWYQEKPTTSLKVITNLNLTKEANCIDIGGGNSNLIGELQNQDYSNLSVLDISEKALERTKTKLGKKANLVNWIVSDIINFKPKLLFDVWHDRAVFHFLTKPEDITNYVKLVGASIKTNGYFILATFSKTGPLKCSGLDISQYNKEELIELFKENFKLVNSFEEVHQTPFNTEQNFIYAVFQKK